MCCSTLSFPCLLAYYVFSSLFLLKGLHTVSAPFLLSSAIAFFPRVSMRNSPSFYNSQVSLFPLFLFPIKIYCVVFPPFLLFLDSPEFDSEFSPPCFFLSPPDRPFSLKISFAWSRRNDFSSTTVLCCRRPPYPFGRSSFPFYHFLPQFLSPPFSSMLLCIILFFLVTRSLISAIVYLSSPLPGLPRRSLPPKFLCFALRAPSPLLDFVPYIVENGGFSICLFLRHVRPSPVFSLFFFLSIFHLIDSWWLLFCSFPFLLDVLFLSTSTKYS